MKNSFWVILILGIILRIFLAAFSFHPDVTAFQLGGQIMASGNILNFYDYLSQFPPQSDIIRKYTAELFIYPPAIYWFHGIFNFLFAQILGLTVLNDFVIVTQSIFGNPLFNWHLLLLKIPYIIFDIPIAFLLGRFFISPRARFAAFTLWMFNPVNLYTTYLMGQFDVIPTFFVVASLVLARGRKLFWAALVLGGGIAFKLYPLYLLIPLAILGKKPVKQLKLAALGVIPYLISILPYLTSRGFRSSALVAGQTLKSLYAQIPVSGGESIFLFPLFLASFYLILFILSENAPQFTAGMSARKNSSSEGYSAACSGEGFISKEGEEDLWKHFFIVLLLFFAFTHYHPQWFLWLTPFLIIELVSFGFRNLILAILSLFSFVGLLFFFDPSLTIGIFAPLVPSFYSLPSIWEILHLNPDYNLWRSILQTLFVAAAIVYVYLYFPKRIQALNDSH